MDRAIHQIVERWRQSLARSLIRPGIGPDEKTLTSVIQRTVEHFLFRRMCESRGLEPYGALGTELRRERRFDDLVHDLYDAQPPHTFSQVPPEILGRAYEHFLDRPLRPDPFGPGPGAPRGKARRAEGVYYTPGQIVDHIVRHTIGPLWPGTALRILDPACGGGFFLLAAYRFLLGAYLDRSVAEGTPPPDDAVQGADGQWRLTVPGRIRILRRHIHGVDIDPQAVEVTRRGLLLEALDGDAAGYSLASLRGEALAALARQVRCGNAIIGPDFHPDRPDGALAGRTANGIDWPVAFPEALRSNPSGFDAVVGNPPWGQKDMVKDGPTWAYLRNRYRSLAGIADVFRPFVERAVTLVRPGGVWGMVLPDIVLLKDYVETRRFLLDELSLTHVDWWGMAFSSATIDVTTLIGRRAVPPPRHGVRVTLRDGGAVVERVLRQEDFRRNDRLTFNLHLTPERRAILDHLAGYATLGALCEMHEGVHSGNLRSELFVDRPVDASCRPLLFGRDEIAPYALRWNGKHVRLSAVPRARTPERYANAGRPDWYDREKLLVRRTGDFVLAAVDRDRRYASNNFFLVWPVVDTLLTLDGFCALLNSPLITWFFRCIEPRQGRAFAELKIKHLRRFPAPSAAAEPALVIRLNDLAAYRVELTQRCGQASDAREKNALAPVIRDADQRIADAVFAAFGFGGHRQRRILSETSQTRARPKVTGPLA